MDHLWENSEGRVALATAVLGGLGLAFFFAKSELPKKLTEYVQTALAGQVSTSVLGVPGFELALLLSFAVGLSTLATPCGLPILFSAIPSLAEKKNKRGVVTGLLLFSAGLALVLVLIGFVLGFAGGTVLALLGAYTKAALLIAIALFSVAGAAILLWGLAEFGILRLPQLLPDIAPEFLSERGGSARPFLFGAALGAGLGLGCPLPTYHAVLFWAALVGNPFFGAALLLANAVGRLVPLLAIGAIVLFAKEPKQVARFFTPAFGPVRLLNAFSLVLLGVFWLVFWPLVLVGA